MPGYDVILFDAGETLVSAQPSFGALLHMLLEQLGHTREAADVERHARLALADAVATATAEGWTWSTSNEASQRFWTGIYRTLLVQLGIDDESGSVATEIYAQFTKPERYGLFPDALPALRELKAHGYRLGVISNWEDWLESLLVELKIIHLFDVVVVSGACGIEKPDTRIFTMALDDMKVAPERACYVGDSLTHDVAPALALGMGAVLIDRHDRHAGAHRPTIQSLGQLAAVL